MGEIVVILIVALLVLGPEKLPEAAKTIGRTIRELRKHTDNLKETIEQDEHIGGTVRELKSALRGDVYAPGRSMVKPQGVISQPTEDPKLTAANAEMASWNAGNAGNAGDASAEKNPEAAAEPTGDRANRVTSPATPAAIASKTAPPSDPKNG